MHLTAFLLMAVASGVMTSPLAEDQEQDVGPLLYTEDVNGVKVYFYGEPEGKSSGDSPLVARGSTDCGGWASTDPWYPPLQCDDDNTADDDVCQQLLNVLAGDPGYVVPADPRQICVPNGGRWCCTSWSANIDTISYGDLYEGAARIITNCHVNGISGYIPDLMLAGTDYCVHQCVSNRGTKC